MGVMKRYYTARMLKQPVDLDLPPWVRSLCAETRRLNGQPHQADEQQVVDEGEVTSPQKQLELYPEAKAS